ncbi:Acylphosphatase [Hyaloscypha variabilis]
MAKRVSFTVHGRVQRVNFRNFTKKQATVYGLTGWVRNTADNTVEGEVQGEDEVLEKFFKDIDVGPRYAIVEKVEKSDIELLYDEFFFMIRR